MPDGKECLGLFDGVDAEVGFHIQIKVEHLLRIAGLLGDDGQDFVGDWIDGRRLADDRCRRRFTDGGLRPAVDGRYGSRHNRLGPGLFDDDLRLDFYGLLPVIHRLPNRSSSRRPAVDGWGDHSRRQFHCRYFAAGRGAHRRAGARLPAIGHWRAGGRALGDNAQGALDDFGFGCVVAADVGQPAAIHGGIIHSIEAAGDTSGEGERDL